MMEVFMGIDIGTSGVRAAIFDRKGRQLSLDHVEYPMICTENDMAELDPEVVLNSLVNVVKNSIDIAGIRAEELEGIGLSTQLFSFMALDAAGEKLTNIITKLVSEEHIVFSVSAIGFLNSEFSCSDIKNVTL